MNCAAAACLFAFVTGSGCCVGGGRSSSREVLEVLFYGVLRLRKSELCLDTVR